MDPSRLEARSGERNSRRPPGVSLLFFPFSRDALQKALSTVSAASDLPDDSRFNGLPRCGQDHPDR